MFDSDALNIVAFKFDVAKIDVMRKTMRRASGADSLIEAKPLLERRAAIDIKGLAGYMWRAHKIESHFRHVLFALRLTLGHEVIDGTRVGFFGRFAGRRECVV